VSARPRGYYQADLEHLRLRLVRHARRHGYGVYGSGGDKIIVAPPNLDPIRRRQTVRIGLRFTNPGTEILWGHLHQIGRAFGVTAEDLISA
jgi:hypothetical protein